MASRKQRSKRRKSRRPEPRPPAETEPESGGESTSAGRPAPSKRPGKTLDERPPAPWGNFPLVQIAVVASLILIVLGAVNKNPTQLVIGLGLGSMGGLELSVREHFAGYRSHTTLLAGIVYVLALGLTFFVAKLVLWQSLIIAVALAALAFWGLRKRFEKASGGLTYKIK